jgi:hypothetical protein
MSGNYPDVPGPRMAYHRDGSVGFFHNGGAVTVLTAGQMTELNDEDNNYLGGVMHSDSFGGGWWVGVIFPELRDIDGWFVFSPAQYYFPNTGTAVIETSPDSTSGLDGTWTSHVQAASSHFGVATQPGYRTNIYSSAFTGKKAFRIRAGTSGGGGTVDLASIHLYGKPSTGETRFLILTDTSDVEVGGAYFDFGDDPRSGPDEDRVFRVKNAHPTLTADTITVSFNVLVDKSPSFADDYTFSDGGAFGATVNIASLAPGASSGDITVRRTTPLTAQLGLETGFILAAAASWT